MNREEYLEVRKSKKITLENLYNTLLINPTFKIENLDKFSEYYEILTKVLPNVNSILFKEFVRINDIKFSITKVYNNNNEEIRYY